MLYFQRKQMRNMKFSIMSKLFIKVRFYCAITLLPSKAYLCGYCNPRPPPEPLFALSKIKISLQMFWMTIRHQRTIDRSACSWILTDVFQLDFLPLNQS